MQNHLCDQNVIKKIVTIIFFIVLSIFLVV